MRAMWLLLVLVLAGCSAEVTGAPAKDDSPVVGPVSLVVPIELSPVVEPGSPSAAELTGPDGERLSVTEPVMVIERLDGAQVENANGYWVLTLDLTDEDAKTFADWTGGHTGERLAIVVDGEVVVAPEIQEAITGGEVQISGDYTQDDVQELLDKITGR